MDLRSDSLFIKSFQDKWFDLMKLCYCKGVRGKSRPSPYNRASFWRNSHLLKSSSEFAYCARADRSAVVLAFDRKRTQ